MFSLLVLVHHIVFVSLILCIFIYGTKTMFNWIIPDDRRKSGYALITGCDTGFGYITALALSKQNIYTFAGCLTEVGVQILNEDPSFKGTAVLFDVTKGSDIEKVKRMIESKVGTGGLHCLINNAGICQPGPIEWMSVEDMKRSMEVNLWGCVNVTKRMLPLVKLGGGGRIVVMSSISGRVSDSNFSSYTMTKYALEAFSDSLRHEMKPWNVSVHVIEPGHHVTNLFNDFKNRWKDLWEEQPCHIKEEYGEEYYPEVLKATEETMSAFESNNHNVVDAYLHACLSSRPKLRYVIGIDAKTAGLVVANFPTAVADFIRSKLFTQVLPAACKGQD